MIRLQKTLLWLVLLTLALPLPSLFILRTLAPSGTWADWSLNRTLHGVTLPEQSVAFGTATWFSGQYQRSVTSWVNQHFAFRELAIRCYNQLLWSLFGKSYMANESIIRGKDDWLFEIGYLQDYNYLAPQLSDAQVQQLADRLVQVQRRLASHGTSFVVLVTPSKATFYPEFVPDRFKTNLENKPRRNYERVVERLKECGVPVVDGPLTTRRAAVQLPGNAFPQTGVHWSQSAAFFTAEEFLRVCERVSGKTLARLREFDTTVDKQPVSPDNDIALLLNLAIVPSGTYTHSKIELSPDSPRHKGRLTIVGGSFVHQLTAIWAATDAWQAIEHYYYYKVSLFRYPGNAVLPVDESTIDWARDFYAADVVALEINEVSFGWNHPNAFISGFLAAPEPPPVTLFYPTESWHDEEKSNQRRWRWSSGDARLEFTNAKSIPVSITLNMGLISNIQPRQLRLTAPTGETLWQGVVGTDGLVEIPKLTFELPPGRSSLSFSTDHQGTPPAPGDPRLLAFAMYDLTWATGVANDRSGPTDDSSAVAIDAEFRPEQWHAIEKEGNDSWRWTKGSATIRLNNPGVERQVVVAFALSAFEHSRRVEIKSPSGNRCWNGVVNTTDRTAIQFECTIPSGTSNISLETLEPPLSVGTTDPRQLAVAMYNFTIQQTAVRLKIGPSK